MRWSLVWIDDNGQARCRNCGQVWGKHRPYARRVCRRRWGLAALEVGRRWFEEDRELAAEYGIAVSMLNRPSEVSRK